METNVYRRLLALLPEDPLDVGDVVEVTSNGCRIRLLGGQYVTATGDASIGDFVYIRNGAIVGPAPVLSTVEIVI